MTQKQFNQEFKSRYPNFKLWTLTDRRVYYNALMETYRKDGLITEKQANTWGHPDFLTKNRDKINCSAY